VSGHLRAWVGGEDRRRLALFVLLVLLLAGCSEQAKANPPSVSATTVTNTTSAFSHSQVLGWITPTLANGISLVYLVPPDASPARLAAASKPLGTAASVSLHDLAEASWTGPLRQDEQALVRALERTEELTKTAPDPATRQTLDTDILNVKSALRILVQAADG